MSRASIQPFGTSISSRAEVRPTRTRHLPLGFGLLIGAGVSCGLWAGVAGLVVVLLR